MIIAGGGPAGRALAHACASAGQQVTLITPTSGWPATYGMWLDEVSVLPPGAKWVSARTRAAGRWLSRQYVVLDNESVLAGLAHPAITVVRGRVHEFAGDHVTLGDGSVLRALLVFDATGAPRAGTHAEQTAYGVAVDATSVVGADEAVFMDWRPPPGFGEPATFLYAVPLPDGRMLLEETSLARRPGLPMTELKARLLARVGDVRGEVERVRFPVDIAPPPCRGRGPIPFGAAAGFVHPATGFSIADTFRLATRVAKVAPIGERAVRRVLWPLRARLVYRLRVRGLDTLLTLTAAEHEEFFDLFFALPPDRQRAYLSGRADLRGTAAAMLAMYRAAPAHLRRKMAGW